MRNLKNKSGVHLCCITRLSRRSPGPASLYPSCCCTWTQSNGKNKHVSTFMCVNTDDVPRNLMPVVSSYGWCATASCAAVRMPTGEYVLDPDDVPLCSAQKPHYSASATKRAENLPLPIVHFWPQQEPKCSNRYALGAVLMDQNRERR